MIAVVIKGFQAGTTAYRPGDVVDTTGWRNAERMLRARQIRPAAPSEVDQFTQTQKGRRKTA